MLCPVCEIDLIMSERQGIEIDYCPQCRGVWLDRGELDKIIERSNKQFSAYSEYPEANRADAGYEKAKRGHDKHKRNYRRKKRDSILEEIFDIFD